MKINIIINLINYIRLILFVNKFYIEKKRETKRNNRERMEAMGLRRIRK